jgi:tetratricopeptide (TPR) repeat protein
MLMRMLAVLAALMLMAVSAEAGRVALVIGQNAYAGLPSLDNPGADARSMGELLAKHGFATIACDSSQAAEPACHDLDRTRFLKALDELQARAEGADLALVYFAGHGAATDEGNMLTPTDARIDCATGAVVNGVSVERIMAATGRARHKLVILDACRDNPLGEVCPGLKGKKLSFTRIEAGALRGFLLVTSTQFGQTALDGPEGEHSPFAAALLAALEANPGVYFDQVLNEVARATYDAAQKQGGFLQIPGRVVGGEAPADCLAGSGCVGDARLAALANENERLASDASGVRAILALEEQARGKAYTAEERGKRVAELQETLTRMATSTDPLRQEARRLITVGDVAGGEAKLNAALDADEKAIAEAERVAAEKRTAAARSARDLAVLARKTDVAKAVAYFQRATRLDPSDAETWNDYARAAVDAGRTDEAKVAFEQAIARAGAAGDARQRYWAMLGLGGVMLAQGSLLDGLRQFQAAAAVAEPIVMADPGNARWQRDLSVSQQRIGDAFFEQRNLPAALDAYRADFAIAERLAKADPDNALWQHDLSSSLERMGDVLHIQGNLPASLDAYQACLAIEERFAKADPGNAQWQRDLSGSHDNIGDVLADQGNLPAALAAYQASLAIRERLTKADAGNAGWQRDLSLSRGRIGDMLRHQGDLPAALAAYQASLAIIERLTKADPGNARWQRDLAVSQERIGDVLRHQGDPPAALAAYQASLAIIERFAKADPGNAQWQRDLSGSHDNIGDVLADQGNLPAALDAYRASLAIRERLTKADAGNAGWQRDLSLSRVRIGDVLFARGNTGSAIASWREALGVAEVLAARAEAAETKSAGKPGRDTAEALGNVAWHALLARNFKKALAASERAHALAPDLVWIDSNRAHALLFLERTREASALYPTHKGKMSRNKPWERAIAEDFVELRKAGLAHPLMSQIERTLGIASK